MAALLPPRYFMAPVFRFERRLANPTRGLTDTSKPPSLRWRLRYHLVKLMIRAAVISSSIRAVGYSPQSQTLEVEFVNGGIYRYFNVPEHIHAGLMAARSHGGYLDAHIKDGGYRFERVG